MTTPPGDTQEHWEQIWLPQRPYATDDLLTGIYRMSRPKALVKRYIEANPQAMSNLLVVDIDHPDAVLRALWDRAGWFPNAIVENPHNGHAHAVWALSAPVIRTEYAHRKPLAYATAVSEGLRRAVDGDQGYSGLMTKNPAHRAWETRWITDELYALDDLAARLEALGHLPDTSWTRTRRRNPTGLGRNCALFETARTWAYRELRHHFGDPHGLATAIHTEVTTRNAEYHTPLPPNEAHTIATSITRWITTRSRMWHDGPTTYEATFTTIQAARGRKGGQASGKVRRQGLEGL
ncbi:hypothetical protein KEM60_02961 [Austwickia sp. TVS 96-490-7B]|uniref:replication initiation protein n=1 Tax=Austwickia sp. TVS 96-490-7B TaxID=2830843 RepID=UPI001D5CF8CE|nr:replication initiation protein [Austwickia sp. TVS 96-490-7B]MBW3086732.1 hypothetical protein [Austwickia sp. TVS 96-490-7B]